MSACGKKILLSIVVVSLLDINLEFFLLMGLNPLRKSLFAGTPTSYLPATIGQPEKTHKGSANRKRELMRTAAQGVPANNAYHKLYIHW